MCRRFAIGSGPVFVFFLGGLFLPSSRSRKTNQKPEANITARLAGRWPLPNGQASIPDSATTVSNPWNSRRLALKLAHSNMRVTTRQFLDCNDSTVLRNSIHASQHAGVRSGWSGASPNLASTVIACAACTRTHTSHKSISIKMLRIAECSCNVFPVTPHDLHISLWFHGGGGRAESVVQGIGPTRCCTLYAC